MPRRRSNLPEYCYEDTDRHGNVRVYLRMPGKPKVRLHGMNGTPEFLSAYAAARYGAPAPERPKIEEAKQETWRWLCKSYMASVEFQKLTGTTPATRRRNLEWTWDQPINPDKPELKFGDMPVSKMTPDAIYVLRDRKAGKNGEHLAAANLLVKIVSYVFAHGVDRHRKLVPTNPVRDAKKFTYESDGWHTWTEDQLKTFMDFYQPGTKERRAMALMIYTGARGCDARKFGPQMIRDGWLGFRQQKLAKAKAGKAWVELPLHVELVKELDLAPKGDLAFILTAYGKTFSQKGYGQWFNAKCRKAGLTECTAHGLRKAAATIAANNGASVLQLMAMFGWMTEQQAIHYTDKANRKQLAAVAVALIQVSS